MAAAYVRYKHGSAACHFGSPDDSLVECASVPCRAFFVHHLLSVAMMCLACWVVALLACTSEGLATVRHLQAAALFSN
jgi:hypothetical protein